MKQHSLSLFGATRAERHKTIAEVGDAIAAVGGWIVDHTLFSNTAITIRFVLPTRGLDELQRRLTAASVRLDDASLAGVRQSAGDLGNKDDEIGASLSITFIHDELDLLHVVPPIPG